VDYRSIVNRLNHLIFVAVIAGKTS
jgi:hypothetical protein